MVSWMSPVPGRARGVERPREIRGHGALANTALAAGNGDHVPDTGDGRLRHPARSRGLLRRMDVDPQCLVLSIQSIVGGQTCISRPSARAESPARHRRAESPCS